MDISREHILQFNHRVEKRSDVMFVMELMGQTHVTTVFFESANVSLLIENE